MRKSITLTVINLFFASMAFASPQSEGYHKVKLSPAQLKQLSRKYHCKNKFNQAFAPHFDSSKKVNYSDQSIKRCFYLMDGWIKK